MASNRLKVVVSCGDGPPRVFERGVDAPPDDVAAAVSMGMIAFDEAFDLELEWIRRRSAEEVAAYCEAPAA